MYQDTKAYIKLNNKLSNSFICNIGVRLEGAFSLMEALFYNNTQFGSIHNPVVWWQSRVDYIEDETVGSYTRGSIDQVQMKSRSSLFLIPWHKLNDAIGTLVLP